MARVAAVLLAAGRSTRMGSLKALLGWGGKPLIAHQADALREAGIDQIAVVLGHEAERLKPLVEGKPGVRVVYNPRYREGKTTSIRAGVLSLSPDIEHLLLIGVDQPRSAATLRAVLDAHLQSGALITKPYYRGAGGHPPVFARALFSELAGLREEVQGLKELMRRRIDDMHRTELDAPDLLLDLNRPEEYAAATQRPAV